VQICINRPARSRRRLEGHQKASARSSGGREERRAETQLRQNEYLQRFTREDQEGEVPLNKPLLVLAGEADQSIPIEGVRELVARSCRNGTALQFKSYPGLDHDPTMSNSMPDQLAWIRDRFAGKPAPSNCPRG
jgi:hypothetical protein